MNNAEILKLSDVSKLYRREMYRHLFDITKVQICRTKRKTCIHLVHGTKVMLFVGICLRYNECVCY